VSDDPLADLERIALQRQKLNEEWRAAILRAVKAGKPKADISARGHVSRAWIYRIVQSHKEGSHP
jgi:hypothetical protein